MSRYYFRFSALDKPGVLSKISGILGNYNISITSVIQKGRKIGEAVPLVVLTHEAKEKDVRQALDEIDKLPVVKDKTVVIRVEGKEENNRQKIPSNRMTADIARLDPKKITRWTRRRISFEL